MTTSPPSHKLLSLLQLVLIIHSFFCTKILVQAASSPCQPNILSSDLAAPFLIPTSNGGFIASFYQPSPISKRNSDKRSRNGAFDIETIGIDVPRREDSMLFEPFDFAEEANATIQTVIPVYYYKQESKQANFMENQILSVNLQLDEQVSTDAIGSSMAEDSGTLALADPGFSKGNNPVSSTKPRMVSRGGQR